MNSTPTIVKEILEADDIAIESLRLGILNLTAYAANIHKEVEKRCKKNVKVGTIVVSLARISKQLEKILPLKPKVKIDNMIIKSPLSDLTYEKTLENTKKLSKINNLVESNNDFFTSTQGIEEITIVCSSNLVQKIEKHFDSKPIAKFDELIAVCVSFQEEYLKVPNVIYQLVSSVAQKRVNIIEIISTYTELTFIINNRDLQSVIQVLENFFDSE